MKTPAGKPPPIDVLLVRPYSDMPLKTPPLGLGYLAASLRESGITAGIKDFLIEDSTFRQLASFIKERSVKLVGVSCCTNEVPWVKAFAEAVKASAPVKIVAGGPHPSGALERTFEDIPGADFIVYSEGERALPLLARAVIGGEYSDLGSIPNLIWKNGGTTVKNRAELPDTLDSLPFPDRELISPKIYSRHAPHGFIYRKKPFASMITTRGCPFQCAFCGTGAIHGKTLRKRSPENIIAEIELLRGKYGVREIFFEDDNFTADAAFVSEVCGRIEKYGLGMAFSLPNGVCLGTLNEKMLGELKKAGFYSFAAGIESGSPRILKSMNKENDLAMLESKVAMASKAGFYVTGFFILGYPGETAEDIEATIGFAKRLKINKAAFAKYIPLPGTSAYDELLKNGEITRLEPFSAISNSVPYSPKGIPRAALKNYIKKAVLSFYLRPSVIFAHLLKPRFLLNFRALGSIIKRFIFD